MTQNVDFLSHESVNPQELSALLDSCFGPARLKRTAALMRAQAPRIETASFAAIVDDVLVGSVECWEMEWHGPNATRRIALLGPLVSHPDYRGLKIGIRLMDLALAELDKLHLPVFLIGDAAYYGRWGFNAQHTKEWQLPGPVDRDRLLLKSSAGHRMRGPAQLLPVGTSESAQAAA